MSSVNTNTVKLKENNHITRGHTEAQWSDESADIFIWLHIPFLHDQAYQSELC